MADYLGIQYNRTPAQLMLRQRFESSLNPTQLSQQQASNSAFKSFAGELNPEQTAARQKWRLEKMEGAPPAQWQADKQAFLATLNPQQQQARNNALALRKEFRGSLSPEQKDVNQSLIDLRKANVLSALGFNGPSGNPASPAPTPPTYGSYSNPASPGAPATPPPSLLPGSYNAYA